MKANEISWNGRIYLVFDNLDSQLSKWARSQLDVHILPDDENHNLTKFASVTVIKYWQEAKSEPPDLKYMEI